MCVGDETLPFRMSRIDAPLWAKTSALTRETLQARFGPWVGKAGIGAILKRRDKMQKEIDALVASRGGASVILC